MSRMLFVVSTGRTGTQWLANTFAAAGADAYHERGPRAFRLVSNAYAAGKLSAARASWFLQRWRGDVHALQHTPYFEASVFLCGLVAPILATFHDAEVVQVVRNPLTFAQSAMNWGQYRLAGRPLNLIPFRRPAPPQYDPWSPTTRARWVATDQFGRLCWAWTAMNRTIREQGAASPRFSTLRYEDLVSPDHGHETLGSMFARVGLTPGDHVVAQRLATRDNESTTGSFPPWNQWSVQRLNRLVEVCGAEAQHYGYDLEAIIAGR